MKLTLSAADRKKFFKPLKKRRPLVQQAPERQPLHTFYGGAHLFREDAAAKIGSVALRGMEQHAPTPEAFAEIFGLTSGAQRIHEQVVEKLKKDPVEDYRIDFEDGFGPRPDAEEDEWASKSAEALAAAMRGGPLPLIGIRIKSFAPETRERAIRTLDIFLSKFKSIKGAKLPHGFCVTLPKISEPAEAKVLHAVLSRFEAVHRLPKGSIRTELMIETPESLVGPDGAVAVSEIATAGGSRCRGLHFGTFDLTSALDVASPAQSLAHPLSDFARTLMQFGSAGSGLWISDSIVNRLPVASDVAGGWRESYRMVRRALSFGIYQGWDIHPAQLVARYAAVYAFFFEGLELMTARLERFLEERRKAIKVGSVFDDEATVRGLVNFFRRGVACGAVEPSGVIRDFLASLIEPGR